MNTQLHKPKVLSPLRSGNEVDIVPLACEDDAPPSAPVNVFHIIDSGAFISEKAMGVTVLLTISLNDNMVFPRDEGRIYIL